MPIPVELMYPLPRKGRPFKISVSICGKKYRNMKTYFSILQLYIIDAVSTYCVWRCLYLSTKYLVCPSIAKSSLFLRRTSKPRGLLFTCFEGGGECHPKGEIPQTFHNLFQTMTSTFQLRWHLVCQISSHPPNVYNIGNDPWNNNP